jgi:hypothetical protein
MDYVAIFISFHSIRFRWILGTENSDLSPFFSPKMYDLSCYCVALE